MQQVGRVDLTLRKTGQWGCAGIDARGHSAGHDDR